MGLQVSTGVTQDKDGRSSFAPSGNTTISLSSQGHRTEGRTQATLGQGAITVGDKALEEQDQYASLNRNVNEGQITTLEQQTAGLNASATVDNRWLTEKGRESLLNDQKDLGKNSAMAAAGALTDVARVGAAATAAVTDPGQVINAWETVGQAQELAYGNEGKTAAKIEAARDGEIQNVATLQGALQEGYDVLSQGNGEQVRVTDGTGVYGAINDKTDTVYTDLGQVDGVVNTLAHESMHAKGAGEATATVTGYLTDLAYQANAWANSEQIGSATQVLMKEFKAAPAVSEAENRALLDKNNKAFWEDAANNELDYRQRYSSETERIKELAAAKAKEVCNGNASCETSVNLKLTDMLERAAESRIDTQAASQNQEYYQKVVTAAETFGSEAWMGAAEDFFSTLNAANQMLDADAGKPILDNYGRPVLGTDGKPQTYFSATQEQKDNPYGNTFLGSSPDAQTSIIPGAERRDAERLEYFNTPNGSATPIYPVEEILLGGAIFDKFVKAVGAVLGGTGLKASGEVVDNATTGLTHSLDDLSAAAGVASGKNGFSAAGHSLTKHGIGKREGNSLFPAPAGNAAAINQQAQTIVDDILTTPGTTVTNGYRSRFGNTIEHVAPDGRGVVFDSNGNFLFFREGKP